MALPLVLRRRYLLAIGSYLPSVYPFIVGVVVHFSYSAVDPNGVQLHGREGTSVCTRPVVDGRHRLDGIICRVLGCSIGRSRLAAIGAAAVMLVITAPRVFDLMNDVTGAHAVLWRAVWVAPVAVLVGMVAAVPLPFKLRWFASVPAIVLIGAILAVGMSFSAPGRHTKISGQPTWRFPMEPVRQARAVMQATNGSGPVLAPSIVMSALAVTTSRVHAVDPFSAYVPLTDEPAQNKAARLLLGGWVKERAGSSLAEVRAALTRLDVSMACFPEVWTHGRRFLVSAGYSDATRIRKLICYQRPGGEGTEPSSSGMLALAAITR